MSNVARQLLQLQEIDLEIDSNEQSLRQVMKQLGDGSSVMRAQARLDAEKKALSDILRQQRLLDLDIEAVAAKLKKVEDDLYGGRIRNPKELTDLQHEGELVKSNLSGLEEQALELMEKVEAASRSVTAADSDFNRLQTEWQQQQSKLTADKKKLESSLSVLSERRDRAAGEIDPDTIKIYEGLRKQKGTAVARVEQGICHGCRLALPTGELQRVRGGEMVRCSGCGRILCLA